MKYRTLGPEFEVSALGLGCMPMAGVGRNMYGQADEAESIATIHRAIELGVTLFDTAEIYGPLVNEELVGRAIRGQRDAVVIATKFGFRYDENGMTGVDSTPANVQRACEGSLRRLGVETIDLFYQHRVDPNVPIEDTIGAMGRLVEQGKVRRLGLSEASAETIRRAAAVHPIAAVQSEYSLWERDVEADILPVVRELGIGFVPYSPLGRGFLTGQITRREDLPEGDYRRNDPRYSEENFDRNMALVEVVKQIAAAHDASAAQVALAWLLAQGDDIVPIPGSKRRVTLEDSMKAAELTLSAGELATLDEAAPRGGTAGPRYGERAMAMTRL
ncbi:aryl-alcohol dehydrogenase-like predicted oxidoreductase [Sphingomonas sp. SORGH_AS 950]|uniref:aldo/keto reductase n=1 Tax=Sphingomonas sp. SORGH_AS_0950 TaxID=3041792 RepID=UPI0027834E52|nr:aldo/keto reductase [Sphingomonas sp. SORGH_AS_0950]MDQ1158129.1 aryl-alcohol dehydrogenase-like predicted oxidoreductase [Sphingomonas sp. SORGH_AS_0950]